MYSFNLMENGQETTNKLHDTPEYISGQYVARDVVFSFMWHEKWQQDLLSSAYKQIGRVIDFGFGYGGFLGGVLETILYENSIVFSSTGIETILIERNDTNYFSKVFSFQEHWLGCDYNDSIKTLKTVCITDDSDNPLDLAFEPIKDKAYTLGVCTEVFEHMESIAHVNNAIEFLRRECDVLIFSAACPYQPGEGHNPELQKWPSFWAELFVRDTPSGIKPLYPLYLDNGTWRHAFSEKDILPWYAQNVLVLVSEEYFKSNIQFPERVVGSRSRESEWIIKTAHAIRQIKSKIAPLSCFFKFFDRVHPEMLEVIMRRYGVKKAKDLQF